MLAATSRRDSPIGLFEAILRSLQQTPQVGAPLREHAVAVLQAACDIARDPSHISSHTPPEAIETLSAALQKALKDPTVVERLSDLGAQPASQEQATPQALDK